MSKEWMPPVGYEKIAKRPPEYKAKVEELTEGLRMSELEAEAREEIAAIDVKLWTLSVLKKSNWLPNRRRGSGNENGPIPQEQHYELERKIKEMDEALLEAQIRGEDTTETEQELRQLREAEQESNEFFEDEKRAYMVNPDYSSSPEGSDRIRGKSFEDMDDSTQKLIETLEEAGLEREEILYEFENTRFGGARTQEQYVLDSLIGKQETRLTLKKNKLRLAIPNELTIMTGELAKKTQMGDIDFDSYTQNIARRGDTEVSINDIFDTVKPQDYARWDMDEYPEEVHRRYFELIAKRISESERGSVRDTEKLGRDLAEYYSFSTERFRSQREIESDMVQYEKALELLDDEREYIRDLIKADRQVTLAEKVSTMSRFSIDYIEDNPDYAPTWPAVSYKSESMVRKREEQGGHNSHDFKFNGIYHKGLRDALTVLQENEKHRPGRRVDPLDVGAAISRAREKVLAELETLETERERLLTFKVAEEKLAQTKYQVAA